MLALHTHPLHDLRRYLDNVAANRFGTGVGVWFVGNFITNQLISTGAFEVYYDGELVGARPPYLPYTLHCHD